MTDVAKTAYVIDDADLVRWTAGEALKKAGYKVEEFLSVDAAMQHMGWQKEGDELHRNLPDLAFIDYDTLSPHNGLHLLRALKGKNIGLVLQSSHRDVDEKRVKEVGGPSALYCTKTDALEIGYEALAKKALEAAALEKAGLIQKPGGRED